MHMIATRSDLASVSGKVARVSFPSSLVPPRELRLPQH
jgi:hypothetical protein